MRSGRIHLVLLMTVVSAFAACGGASEPEGHGGTEAESAVTAPAPPTPDTTPIEILRTPAGLALKPGTPPVTGTPSLLPAAVGTPPGGTP